jgi:subtilisin family serine protease
MAREEDEMRKIVAGKLVGGLATALALAVTVPSFAGQGPDLDRYILKFRQGKGPQGKAALKAAGASIVIDLAQQDAVAAHVPPQALNGLQNNPNLEYIEPDVVRHPTALWSDTTSGGETTPFGIQMVEATLVSAGGTNRKVCIIDSGYYQAHEDLKDSGVTAKTTDSGSGTWNKDSCGHGSHVAGTISGIAGNGTGVVGVYPEASLHIVKVFGDDVVGGGACAWTYSSTLVDALNNCTAAGANVVSMSLGGGAKSRTEDLAFGAAYNNGVLSIAAAGNDGNRRTSYPAGYDSVVSVAAVDADEVKADFSQYNRDVEIAAPGVGVLSTVPWLENNTLTSGADTVSGGHIEGAARTNGYTNALVDGGRCATAGPWPAGAIVLCQRGDITFADKVNNVKNGGGGAAVIYNNLTSDATCGDFAGTLGAGVTSPIPAISVSCADGTTALGHLGQSGTVVSQVTLGASGYEAWSGTSMATPHVSAVAALVWSHCPDATAAQVRDAMNRTALDKGASGRDNLYGYGIVKAKAALDYLATVTPCN